MAFVEEHTFKYPAEEECLVRRLGSGVIAAWNQVPQETRDLILKEACVVWDREFQVKRLPEKLEAIIKRGAR
jgi:hypothetical protein